MLKERPNPDRPALLNRERLLGRSQFICGPSYPANRERWQKIKLDERLYLAVHPDLEVNQAVDGDKWIAMMGYMLDPNNASATNADILEEMLREIIRGTDVFAYASRFGGRWIVIVGEGEKVRLLHDAMGLRQVCYADVQRTGELWCASGSKAVAGILNLRASQEVLALVESGQWWNREHELPFETTLYDEVRQLLPNHYLDLRSGQSYRYWPLHDLERLNLEDCVERSCGILRGLMESAARRFSLAMGITAGRDSRLVLAASRRIAAGVSYVTVAKPQQPVSDVRVPSELLQGLGLSHDIIPWPSTVDDDFAEVYRENVALPHDVWVPEAQACLGYSGLSKVVVTGSGAEIANYRHRFPPGGDGAVTSEWLSSYARMGGNRLAIESFRAWLAGIPRGGTLNVAEFYTWEQICGRWLAACQLEFDMAWKDILTPYNCRTLLEYMLGVDEVFRTEPDYRLFEAMTLRLWPEVLTIPIPQKTRTALSVSGQMKRLTGRLKRRLWQIVAPRS